ncbi:MAG TPA: hypothetical protein DEF39_11740 [Hungateiclostridium thermocellum]|jgi:hypothetical protein|uniref:5-bromo-4-chloroindolyl phosphate hydrolysis protein n=2 Tax=Acetivibrio thermocellus TaxID=1515 RepID=A3DI32_ACET2|nr:hypothetical protein [Acetivibrio thermocellus]CDG36932.1 hypothetical protein CTHBC1_2337 [Acetivibrio thermocellus BC1]ABN53611.1 hypothetical protein Cthe_2409 [Acetivibrio thermocellus ATCC 27405]ADU73140.1 hypothetical protein Clo1313_0040 [Acetivibrio thermocellus DSM 1313]ALX07051.1 hypothetical protein AD2_00040 [Acetivibrio thermocellus AD2]ANV74787.1 hypothetical protein LQRI_0039 [Acetivibrio thermocellus DSM 2360]
MKLKLFWNAIIHYKNLGVLLISLGIGLAAAEFVEFPAEFMKFSHVYAAIAAAVLYFALVLRSFTDKKFQERFLHKEKEKEIKKMDKTCLKMAQETKKYTNAAYYKKLNLLLKDKDEILKAYNKDKTNNIKEKIAEYALNLTISYLTLLKDFCIRSRAMERTNINSLMERLSQNTRKLNFAQDPKVYEDIKRIVEMDEKIINRFKEEKNDLERLDVKLDYIKSTIDMLKHQINSTLDSQDTLESIESILNEAVAFESVLYERSKNRLRN